MRSQTPRKLKPAFIGGFSLMEVTISLGIVAFAAIPLMGMLSVGMTSNRGSIDRAVISQIVDQIGREVEQTDFELLPSEFDPTYYDEKGVRVESTDSTRIFTARARVIKGVDVPVKGGLQVSQNLARVLVDVAPNPTGLTEAALFQEADGGLVNREAKRFTILVSRND